MANILYYSHLNPIKLYLPSPDTTYESRHIDDFEFFDSIYEWQDVGDYLQSWQTNDFIRLQLMADFGPHNIKILDEFDNLITTVAFDQIVQNEDNPTLWVYECEIDLSILEGGVYRFQYEGGIDDKLILRSNKIDVCERHKYSLLLNYSNDTYHEGIIPTGISFNFRVHGSNLYKSPASLDEDFEDQNLSESLLSSTPYRLFELTIGDEQGVPDYVIDIISRIFTCNRVLIDGRQFVKPKDSKWEVNELEGYPRRAWKLDIREAVNRSSRIYNSNQPQTAKVSIVINSDSKGFGLDTGGTNSQILDVQ